MIPSLLCNCFVQNHHACRQKWPTAALLSRMRFLCCLVLRRPPLAKNCKNHIVFFKLFWAQPTKTVAPVHKHRSSRKASKTLHFLAVLWCRKNYKNWWFLPPSGPTIMAAAERFWHIFGALLRHSQSINQPTNQTINQPTNQPTNNAPTSSAQLGWWGYAKRQQFVFKKIFFY